MVVFASRSVLDLTVSGPKSKQQRLDGDDDDGDAKKMLKLAISAYLSGEEKVGWKKFSSR